jgi:L-glyceraldehyde 3-phosphate reductase
MRSSAQLADSLKVLNNFDFSTEELAEIDMHATDAGIDRWRKSSTTVMAI